VAEGKNIRGQSSGKPGEVCSVEASTMVVVNVWFGCKDTNATSNIIKADLVELKVLPPQGLRTSTRRLGNSNGDAPVPVLHDGGRGSKGDDVEGTPYVLNRVHCPCWSGLGLDETNPCITKKVKVWLRMATINETFIATKKASYRYITHNSEAQKNRVYLRARLEHISKKRNQESHVRRTIKMICPTHS
jgi:hypothetical protein